MKSKRLVFDAVLFAYSASLVLYLASPLSEDEAIARMPQWLGLAALLLVLGAALSLAFTRLRLNTVGAVVYNRHSEGRFWRVHLFVVFLLTLSVSLRLTEFSLTELTDPQGLAGAGRLFSGLAHANFALLPTALVQVIQTVFTAFLATVLAIPVAFVLGFLGTKNLMTHPAAFLIYATTRTVLNLVRSIEPLIWALIFTVWVGVGPFAGMLALMFHTIASLAKQYSEIVEDVDQGPLDGVRATGARPLQVIWFAILPQVTLPFIAFTIYRWDTNVRMATVIGLVGGGGIGTLLIKYQGQAMWPEVGCIILVIAVVVWLMDLASAYIREALR